MERKFEKSVAEMREKKGKIIRCPLARILHDSGGCRSAERKKNGREAEKKRGKRKTGVERRRKKGKRAKSEVYEAFPQRLPYPASE